MVCVFELVEGEYGLVDECLEAAVGESGLGVGVEGCHVAVLGPENVEGLCRVAEGCVEWLSAICQWSEKLCRIAGKVTMMSRSC